MIQRRILPFASINVFSAFLRRLLQNIWTKILLLLRLFSFVIYSSIFIFFLLSAFQHIITFVLFHGFRQHCKHNVFSHDDSRCCLVLYIFAILNIFPDILSQKFDPMIYKYFSGVENIIPILFTSMSQLADLSLD